MLLNGKALDTVVELNHLDRLVFGASQYYTFIDPSKSSPKDNIFTFEMAQDEIANASGMVSKDDKKNMTQGFENDLMFKKIIMITLKQKKYFNLEELQCQGELVDLIPHIEEVNMISIALDKKVKFSALPVSAAARGDYDGKVKVMGYINLFIFV